MKSRSSSNLAPLRPTSKSSFLAVARALMLFLLLALVPRPAVAGDAPASMHALTYDSDSRITSSRGWCIPAQGKDFEVKDKDATERGYTDVEGGELVTDVRVKMISIPAAEPGNIVGFEVEHEDRPYVLQDEWFFQESIPVGEARYTLQLPPSWEYKAVWLNTPYLQPAAVARKHRQ